MSFFSTAGQKEHMKVDTERLLLDFYLVYTKLSSTGNKVKLTINPASPNTGIVFKRVDLSKNNLVYLSWIIKLTLSYCLYKIMRNKIMIIDIYQ